MWFCGLKRTYNKSSNWILTTHSLKAKKTSCSVVSLLSWACPRCPACQEQAQRKRIVSVSSSRYCEENGRVPAVPFDLLPNMHTQTHTHINAPSQTLTETLRNNAQLTLVLNFRLETMFDSLSLLLFCRIDNEMSRRPLWVITQLYVFTVNTCRDFKQHSSHVKDLGNSNFARYICLALDFSRLFSYSSDSSWRGSHLSYGL